MGKSGTLGKLDVKKQYGGRYTNMPKQRPDTDLAGAAFEGSEKGSRSGTKKRITVKDGVEYEEDDYDDTKSMDGLKIERKPKKDDGEVYVRDDESSID